VPVGVANGFDGLLGNRSQLFQQGPGLLAAASTVDHHYGMGKLDDENVSLGAEKMNALAYLRPCGYTL
jgi:hypothetical protein